jgi:hypothetical protein
MILMEQSVGAAPMPPSSSYWPTAREGNTTVIILERDGRISHQAPPEPAPDRQQASVQIPADTATRSDAPSIIDRIVDFAFDFLGVDTLEMRVYEQQR